MSRFAEALLVPPPHLLIPASQYKAIAATALVVDDSPVNRKIAGLHLRKLGFAVETAADGAQSIQLCFRRQFDVIIMDIVLPGINGLDCTRYIRRHIDSTKHAIILGWSTVASFDECLEAGMDGVLPKPLEIDSLSAWLEKLNAYRQSQTIHSAAALNCAP